jgi:hypothetical protein
MNAREDAPTPQAAAPATIDWRDVTRSALGSAFLAGLIGGALHMLGKVIEAKVNAEVERLRNQTTIEPEAAGDLREDPAMPALDGDEPDADAVRAAEVLGVPLDASEDAIRAALRSRLASSRLHPDQGGDAEEAKRLIAARNYLVERARAAQP